MFRDLRYAIRGLLAQPAFTVTAVVTLALAVGVNALMLDTLDRLLGASMFVAFSVLALAISAIGLAGTIAYAIGRTRRELGVRKTLGAQSLDLVRVVIRRSVAVVVVGVLAGLIGAYAGAGAMKALLFGVRPDDWRIFAAAASATLLVAAAAALRPARRATMIDPSELLRSE